jgi:hypothetical protein
MLDLLFDQSGSELEDVLAGLRPISLDGEHIGTTA